MARRRGYEAVGREPPVRCVAAPVERHRRSAGETGDGPILVGEACGVRCWWIPAAASTLGPLHKLRRQNMKRDKVEYDR